MYETYENQDVTFELVKEEPDADLQEELEQELEMLSERLNKYELQMLLSEKYDKNNAINTQCRQCHEDP